VTRIAWIGCWWGWLRWLQSDDNDWSSCPWIIAWNERKRDIGLWLRESIVGSVCTRFFGLVRRVRCMCTPRHECTVVVFQQGRWRWTNLDWPISGAMWGRRWDKHGYSIVHFLDDDVCERQHWPWDRQWHFVPFRCLVGPRSSSGGCQMGESPSSSLARSGSSTL